ncbi:MAG: hypothetical protein KDH98_17125 [Calditrichaeota bacterium]|nr:hypothetical protein [Calditrichota bacterium]
MNFISKLSIFLVVTVVCARAQTRLPDVLLDVPSDTVFASTDSLLNGYQLPHKFIIPNSESLQLKTFALLRGIHYRVDYDAGKIWLNRQMPASDSLRIIYQKYPFPLVADYFHRELQLAQPSDSANGDSTAAIARAVRPGFFDDLDSYQSNLQKSGSIVRGIELGNNQDLTLNSGLNLQLSGQIAPDVEILAALTDESTPIQPEGNTQTLREVDKVFIKLTSPHLGGTLGDFNMQYRESMFGNLQRKLQGISATHTAKTFEQQVTYGTSRGFFHSNRLLGQEGNQGPYLLNGRNGEREIIVLAGTERVYVDGILQTRGENNDYVIDYGLAQITFTNKKLITSENRIEVDFEYTSAFQRYGKTFIGASSTGKPLGKRFSYDVRAFREWDDTNNLLEDDAPLSDVETAALATAGDDPFAAAVSGADSVGFGRGNYVKADTLINGQALPYFRFVDERNGNFLVRFTGVGAGNGDYSRVSLQNYRYVGPGRGSYLPVRLVPLASEKNFADVGMNWRVTDNFSVNGEFAISSFDQNIFSDIDDGDNEGGAFQLASTLRDSTFRMFGKSIGGLNLSLQWQRQDSAFAPLDRPLQPEYAYKWNLGQNQLTTEETSLELNGAYQPKRWLELSGGYGNIEKGASVNSVRWNSQARVYRRPILPDITVRAENVRSETGNFDSDWQRQNVNLIKNIGSTTPQYRFQREDRAVDNLSQSQRTGFLFDDHLGKFSLRKFAGLDWDALAQYRVDYLYNPRNFGEKLRHAATQTYELKGTLNSQKQLRGEFGVTFREKDFTPFFQNLPSDSLAIYQTDAQFQDTTWTDRQSHLGNVQLQYRNESGTLTAQLDYQLASELQAIREIRYLQVEENRGNFRFDSTLSEYVPDPQGDYLRFFFQTGDFRSVIRLETALQVQYRPKASKKKLGFWRDFLNKTAMQSYIKIEEQSRPENIWDIYLMNLSQFHNLQSSLQGVYVLNQDLHYNERNPDWGVLLRSRYRDNLANQFLDANDNETRIVWERSMEARRRIFNRKLNVTASYQHGFNKRWVAALPSRNLNILQQVIAAKLNYRPSIRWQFQLEAERGLDNDRKTVNPLRVNFWELKPQIAFSLRSKARATANLSYLTVQEAENPGDRAIPFEMARGKKPGDSWLWNFRFDYFISQNVTINASYNGRRDAGTARTIHLGKAEVRAFF